MKLTFPTLAEQAIAEARRAAGTRPVEYVRADARNYLRAHRNSFDTVFFHQSLHHFDTLNELMGLVRTALRPDGFLYIDEYVGPSRDEWSPLKLLVPNIVYRTLPRSTWRPHLVRAPINREDPTEAICSSGILPAIDKHFVSTSRRDYGGNLLSVIYPNLAQEDKRAFDAAVRRLIGMEDQLLRLGRSSYYTTLLARPRT
jgi:SAM-dependent methyltransferase